MFLFRPFFKTLALHPLKTNNKQMFKNFFQKQVKSASPAISPRIVSGPVQQLSPSMPTAARCKVRCAGAVSPLSPGECFHYARSNTDQKVYGPGCFVEFPNGHAVDVPHAACPAQCQKNVIITKNAIKSPKEHCVVSFRNHKMYVDPSFCRRRSAMTRTAASAYGTPSTCTLTYMEAGRTHMSVPMSDVSCTAIQHRVDSV